MKTLILLLFVCSVATAQNTALVGYDLAISINLDKAPELYVKSTLNYEIKATQKNIHNLKIEIIAADNIIVDSSKKHISLEILQPEIHHFGAIDFVVNQVGEHKITIKVTGEADGERYTDRYEYIYFTTSQNKDSNKLGWDTKTDETLSVHFPNIKSELQADENGYYHIAAADENLNMVTKKLTQEQFNDRTKGIIGTVRIEISYIMRNRQDNGAYAYGNSLMQLINGTTGSHLAWSYSDDQGHVIFPAVPHPGSDGVSIRVFAVRFMAGGLGYGVCNSSICVDNAASDPTMYSQFYSQTTSKINIPLGGLVNLGLTITPFSLTGSLRAMWIKNDMDDAYAHLQQNSTVRGPFTAEWNSSSTIGNYYNLGGNIHFKADVTDGTNHTVLHELGHNVMYNAGTFPTTPTDCPNPHFVNLISGTQCAWTEGWASAFANMVNDDPTRCFAPSATNCISYEVDPSFDECFPAWDCGFDGHKVEGHVTGALWDLYDADDDGLDINSYGSSEIYAVMEFSPYSAFLSWWTIWKAEGYPFEAANSLYQNAIEFTQSYDIDVYSINTTSNSINPVEGQNIGISVWLKNSGDVTSVGTPVTLYRSLIPIFNGFEPPILTYDLGLIAKNESSLAYYFFPEPNAGTIYYRACYADQHGLDENPSNNCSEIEMLEVLSDVIFVNGFE